MNAHTMTTKALLGGDDPGNEASEKILETNAEMIYCWMNTLYPCHLCAPGWRGTSGKHQPIGWGRTGERNCLLSPTD